MLIAFDGYDRPDKTGFKASVEKAGRDVDENHHFLYLEPRVR